MIPHNIYYILLHGIDNYTRYTIFCIFRWNYIFISWYWYPILCTMYNVHSNLYFPFKRLLAFFENFWLIKFSCEIENNCYSVKMVPVGARLAELARLRLQYDESRRSVQVKPVLKCKQSCHLQLINRLDKTTLWDPEP